jgi:hypothetical protein
MALEMSSRKVVHFYQYALGVLLMFSANAYTQPSSDVAGGFAQLGSSTGLATRTLSLFQLGIRNPIVLHAPESAQELYLPVPAGIPLTDATLQIDGNYMHENGGRVTLMVSVDGSPVVARSPSQNQGDASISIGVDGSPRKNGFIRVGLNWSSVINDNICTDQTAIGNLWRIDPTSRLTYRYDPNAIVDLRSAWSALPDKPVVMLGSRAVTAPGFDAGWRTVALLQRDGRTPTTSALPAIGDTVNLGQINVPAALRSIPAFAALSSGGSHKLANAAEVGALIALAPRSAFAPDIIIADDTLLRIVGTALDALRAQVVSASPEAAKAFDTWRNTAVGAIATQPKAGEVRLMRLGGSPVIVVSDNAGVAVLARTWRPIGMTNHLVVHEIDNAPNARGSEIALSQLGGEPGTLDVQDRATWDATFDLGAAAGDGKLPSEVVFDTLTAPTANNTAQTASIYFNDVLIGTQILASNGKPQRISAHIPRYALGPTNLLRIVFDRQPEGGCQARGHGHAIAVLPSSHLVLSRASFDDNFTGMVARFAWEANVIVPAAYLQDATGTLTRVARLANVSGIAPTRATFNVTQAGTTASPKDSFLAIDAPLDSPKSPAQLAQDRLSLTDSSGTKLADISGLNRAGVIQVVKANGEHGISYSSIGDTPAVLPATLTLSRGDVAIVDDSGLLRQLDSHHQGGVVQADDDESSWGGALWSIAVLAGLVVALVVFANYVRRRSKNKS